MPGDNPFDFREYAGPQAAPPSWTGARAPADPRGLEPREASSASVGQPVLWVAAAAAAAVAGLVIGVTSGADLTRALLGWLLAGPVSFGLLAMYTVRDTARRATPSYTSSPVVAASYWITLAIGVVGVIVCALGIAEWVGRHAW